MLLNFCGCSFRRGSLLVGCISVIIEAMILLFFVAEYSMVINDGPGTNVTIDFGFKKESPSSGDRNANKDVKISAVDEFQRKLSEIGKKYSDEISKADENYKLEYEKAEKEFDNQWKKEMDHLRRKRDIYVNGKITPAKDIIPVLIAGISVLAIQLTSSIVLIVGAKKDNLYILLVGMCASILMLIFYIGFVIYCLCNVAERGLGSLGIIIIGIYAFKLLLVGCHFKELRDNKSQSDTRTLISP